MSLSLCKIWFQAGPLSLGLEVWIPEPRAREPRFTQDLVPGRTMSLGLGLEVLDSRAGVGESTALGNPASAPTHGSSKCTEKHPEGPAW